MSDALSFLEATRLFDSLDEPVLAELAGLLFPVRLRDGEVLFCQGEPGDSLYFLYRGSLSVHRRREGGKEVCLTVEDVGTCIGEMALLTGQCRSATIRAVGEVHLWGLMQTTLQTFASQQPAVIRKISEQLRIRLQQNQLTDVLTDLFGNLAPSILEALQKALVWQRLNSGEVLFKQGQIGQEMYFVINGLLGIQARDADGQQRQLGEVSTGETVGEFSLMTDEPRSATVYAVRDTNLAVLTRSSFEQVLAETPKLLLEITRIIIRRQQRHLNKPLVHRTNALALALLPIGNLMDKDLADLSLQLAAELDKYGPTLYLDAIAFEQNFGKVGAAATDENDPFEPAIVGWLSEQETHYRYLLYVGENGWTKWTQRCVRQADRVLLIGNPKGNPSPGELENALYKRPVTTQTELLFVHPPSARQPTGTGNWLTKRGPMVHHHLRKGDPIHLARLARRLTGRAIGLVLGGGGARGFAHLGVFRAIEECGVPVDCVCGTSMGALLGGMFACSLTPKEIKAHAAKFASNRLLFDYTLPFSALFASAGLSRVMQQIFGDYRIEDLWIPFFSISSNLSTASTVVQRQGFLWHAVRASVAIPGLFTPILNDNGEVLVDGGVVNNFPVDLMRRTSARTIIGVNVSPVHVHLGTYRFGSSISGWRVLWHRLNPFSKPLKVPSLPATLMRVLELNHVRKLRSYREAIDLLIEPNVQQFSVLNFEAYERIAEQGYRDASEALSKWGLAGKFSGNNFYRW